MSKRTKRQRGRRTGIVNALTLLEKWADSVELRTGHRGWMLTCIVQGQMQSCTHRRLDELVAYFIEHAVLEQNWPVGFYRELQPKRTEKREKSGLTGRG